MDLVHVLLDEPREVIYSIGFQAHPGLERLETASELDSSVREGKPARATAALRRNPEVQVLVKADSAVAYGRVVQAMVILQRAGARKVGFITEPLPERARRGS